MDGRGRRQLTTVTGVVVGAALGLAAGAGAYAALAPELEAAEGLVRELQGLAWNLVPFGTVGGGVLGWVVARRWHRQGGS